jgi:citrate lyase subunit beta/citryl-CoA lyase
MTIPNGTRPGPAWLFCPADRPERFAKAAAAADVVILDLEDGVAPRDKASARRALLDTPLDPARTVVRINPAVDPEQQRDLEALSGTEYTTVMLPKSEHTWHITALAPLHIVALVETPRGVMAAGDLAAAGNTAGMMWGAEDLIASLGGGSSRTADGTYRDVARHTRSTVLLAAASFDRFVLDAVHLDIADLDGLGREAADAAAIGFTATACIHPTQVPSDPQRLPAGRPGHSLGEQRSRCRTDRTGGVRVRRPDGRRPAAQTRRGDQPTLHPRVSPWRRRRYRDVVRRSGTETASGVISSGSTSPPASQEYPGTSHAIRSCGPSR